ncbi:hypothetical protein FHR81_002829 [Actinoalloteichus hoggarensis]|uniref:Uncharacterized protein n=1 Tax=Actinoalloteichus hoggarensis TaxID=1470176 RepID=A0A221VY46_9PSEU|nr:hypothetical protein [Actinoalloteichus hoggarensis]ASO18423.1 hypothetical protein AHOG_03835 [Actinoalloteichus hoggarensis]MBB5921789.1 hypothetical protein [Actinoalloteichus hoggarensis]
MIAGAGALVWSALAFGVDDPGGQGEDFGKSSPVGLVLLVLFFIAVGLLVRSMTRHLRRLPASFDPPESEAEGAEGSTSPGSSTDGSAESARVATSADRADGVTSRAAGGRDSD